MAESAATGNSGNGNGNGNGQGQGQGQGQGVGQSVGAGNGNGNGNGQGAGNGNGGNGGNGNDGNGGNVNNNNNNNNNAPKGIPQGARGNRGLPNEGTNSMVPKSFYEGDANQETETESENENNETSENEGPTYNKQGVDANGKTKNGKNGDRNGDGKISPGEAFVNNLSNWAYDIGQKSNSFFGGADENGLTKAGRDADRNGDGKISFGERVSNMLNNAATSINQTFGGVNYQGKNKSGEQVVAPGEHVTLAQRAKNVGHNLVSRNGITWSDTNNNGVMDGGEVGRAAALNAATFTFNLVPGFGKSLGDFAAGAATGKSNSLTGQLGADFGKGGNTNPSTYTGPSQGPGSSTLAPLTENVEKPKTNSNFIKRVKRLNMSSLPAVTSTYIKRGEEKAPAITVSDEELKSFALRFYRQKTIK